MLDVTTNEMVSQTQVLCVAGPTASGKSALALRLAQALGGEIVNMDSMQVYRRMDIGTAKATAAERAAAPHHLLDVAEPTQPFSVADYAALAEPTLHAIAQRGRLPILVGGTGFYLRALTDGLQLGGVRSDPELREQLKAQAAEPGGKERLHERLQAVDPASAARLHSNDVQRVSRALEVFLLTGKPLSAQEAPPIDALPQRPFRFCLLGTTMERAALYHRADARVDAMMAAGLLHEVETLLNEGVPPAAQAMQGIGYKELVPVLRDSAPLTDAVALLKRNTRHYAKRQWTWFRAVPGMLWLDTSQPEAEDEALRIGERFWKEGKA